MSITDLRRGVAPAAIELVDALDRYAGLSAYTSGPDAVTAIVTVAGRTVEVPLPPEAVENLTLIATDLADDIERELGGLESEYAAERASRAVAPASSRRRFAVLPGGAA